MAKDKFDRNWITQNAIEICRRYEHGVLTLRALHYQLVGIGMTNTLQHYKRVVAAMIEARWDGLIAFEQFSDHDREVLGETPYESKTLDESIDDAKNSIRIWMNYHTRNRWEGQPYIVEIWIEKKALQGVFQPICERNRVALAPCKGYPSLTFLNDAKDRFQNVIDEGLTPIILYFGDYDASGEDIPRSIQENLERFGVSVDVKRIGLMEAQVLELGLPPAPTKVGDSRAANWDGLGQVELDAVKPEILQEWVQDAIDGYFDTFIHQELLETVARETDQYKSELKEYVKTL
jgi:hypothetical protein